MVTPANLRVSVHNVLSVVFSHALAGVLLIAVAKEPQLEHDRRLQKEHCEQGL